MKKIPLTTRQKVIQLFKEEIEIKEIAQILLSRENIKISYGSVWNIVESWRLSQSKSTAPVAESNQVAQPLLSEPDGHLISSTPVLVQEPPSVVRPSGCPLSRFIAQEEIPEIEDSDLEDSKDSFSIPQEKKAMNYDQRIIKNTITNEAYMDEIDILDADSEPDIYTDPKAYYDERYDGIKGERRFNQQISRPHVIEVTKETSEEELDQASNSLGMNWDENHEARFVKWVMDQKTARREEERKLQEQWQYLMQEKNNAEGQKRNIEAREAKISEVKDLIPSAQQLKEMGAQFSQVQAFIYCVREKAAAAMMDERTAAWELVKDLELYNVIGGLQKAVAEKSAQLALLASTLEQQKQAIATLVHLHKIGMTEDEIGQLVNLVGGWCGKNNGGNITANSLDSHLNLPNRHKE
ncbi:MAG TPA: hypothetical protein VEL11_08500 [Candidatus Bathyarchaeia archaeon]|nr:hypothetical protein [Candidatus Bathyarchaeia archaeon]